MYAEITEECFNALIGSDSADEVQEYEPYRDFIWSKYDTVLLRRFNHASCVFSYFIRDINA